MEKPFENAELEMTLTPAMAKQIIEFFDLEIEVLQGTTEKLPGGTTKYTISIANEEKAMIVKEFVLKLISQSHNKIMN